MLPGFGDALFLFQDAGGELGGWWAHLDTATENAK